jgi:exodeoxyribonuclease VII small subunit
VAKKNESTINFEASLKELEALVEKMEQGETSLEQSLKDFERGVALTRACQQALRDAEQKVQILTGKDENSPLQEFEGENE